MSKGGKVDVAVMGSPRMIDDRAVIEALAKNRTFANLQENPNAVFIIMEPGKMIFDWKGFRVYRRMKECATSGEMLDIISEASAKIIHAAVTFEVDEIRNRWSIWGKAGKNPFDRSRKKAMVALNSRAIATKAKPLQSTPLRGAGDS